MTMLTGHRICELNIVSNPIYRKVDDGITPSYGMDGMGYTLRSDRDRSQLLLPGKCLHMKSHETVNMPLDCGALLYIKSTYARKNLLLITNSPVDGGYSGPLSLNLYNAGEEPVIIDHLGGIAMLVVWQMSGKGAAYKGRWQNGGLR
jgi:deoxycytidine triphosphate deaminase